MTQQAVAESDYPVIDFGAHLVTSVPESMQALDDIIGPVHTDAEKTIERYESAGIDRLVLSQPPFMGHDDVEETAAANDELLDIIQDHEQLYGLAGLPVGAGGEAAAEELERCLEAGYHGGALETKSHGIKLSDPEVREVFDVAEEHDAPLPVHPKIDDSLHPDTLDDTYRLNAVFGREAALSESILEMIHMGILDEYPDLDLVFHHPGGNIASMLRRLHLHHVIGRWLGQDAIKPYAEFKAQLEERVYIDTAGFFGYHAPVRTALEELPSSQVLFGTDAPYEPRTDDELDSIVSVVEDVASSTDASQVLGGNALDLLTNVE